jgi:diguanylate cyclase (GGDEF)-like protein
VPDENFVPRPPINSQQLILALMLSLGLAFFYAAYKAIENTVADQSRVQQQAISPVYDLVNDELLKPMYIAETFARTVGYAADMSAADFDEQRLLDHLAKMQRDLGLVFFVASEKTRRQYLSSGRTLDLIEGKVAWYFEAKAADKEFFADLGQVGDVHLYFDVKIYGREGEFAGYVGVGKRLKTFLETFDRYKARYGYDFLFVNERNEIMLTSFPDLVVTDAYIPTLQSLDWFGEEGALASSRDSEIIQIENEDFLTSEIDIEQLGWRLLLLSPLEARQSRLTRSFVTNALMTAIIVSLFLCSLLYLLFLNKRSLEKRTERDPLTRLPNRMRVERDFEQMQRDGVDLCAIIIDLDHFKSVNDTHGHDAGDRVLRIAARTFERELREEDTVSRWGGEEFVMLIPGSSIELGQAVAERTRRRLEALKIETRRATVCVTASFGVAFGSASDESLEALLARADEALYRAKADGRNLVRLARA